MGDTAESAGGEEVRGGGVGWGVKVSIKEREREIGKREAGTKQEKRVEEANGSLWMSGVDPMEDLTQ